MAYYMTYETATGRPLSLSSVAPNPVKPGHSVVDIGTKPDKTVMWDEATKAFIPRPPKVLKDRLQDLIDRPKVKTFWQSLNAQQKTTLRDGVIWLLGGKRFRQENETPEIES